MTLKGRMGNLFWSPRYPGGIFKDSVMRAKSEQILGEANHLYNNDDGKLLGFNHH